MDASQHAGVRNTQQPYPDRQPGLALISEFLEQALAFLRRQYLIFAVVLGGAITIGVGYFFLTPAYFTARALLLIDSSRVRVLQQPAQQQTSTDLPIDVAQIETQVEVLRSEDLALSVIKELNLTDYSEFTNPAAGPFNVLRRLPSLIFGDNETEEDRLYNALQTFLKRRDIKRVARTYVLEISYTSVSPGRAAAIANAIANKYLADQLETKYAQVRRASGWLGERISELRSQALAADRAVLDYKEKNKIIDVGTSNAPESPNPGRLIGEQQLTELNSQLVAARGTTSEAKARLERINDVLKRDVREAAVPDSLKSDVINRLRGQYLDLAARETLWANGYGPNHAAVVNLRRQMEELRASIYDELNRIAVSYKNEYEIAKAREQTLEQNLLKLVSEGQSTKRDRLGLNELESSAKVNRSVYDSFLQRYMEIIQQQSFPITEARLINSASAMTADKAGPLITRVMAITTVLGLFAGFCIAIIRESFDLVFRSAKQVEDALHVPCLAVLRRLKPAGVRRGAVHSASRPGSRRAPKSGPPSRPAGAYEVVEAATAPAAVAFTDALMRKVVREPLSAFAEDFRGIKVAAELQAAIKENKVIGVTSTVPGEGKSTVASNLAQLMAHAGKHVILVDADLRRPTLIRCLDPKPIVGLLDVLSGKSQLESAVHSEAATGLSILPSLAIPQLVHSDETLSSDKFRLLIERLRSEYDFVILDLPPLAPVVDVRAMVQIIDSIVLVIEWGGTRVNLVKRQLNSAPEVYDRILGVVLNKADKDTREGHGRYYESRYHEPELPHRARGLRALGASWLGRPSA